MTTDADKIDNLLAQRRELMDKIEEQIDEQGRIIERIQSAPDTPIDSLRKKHHVRSNDNSCDECFEVWPCDTIAALDALEAQLDAATEHAPYGTCDWGGCNVEVARWRYSDEAGAHLPVCMEHSLEAENARLREQADALANALENMYSGVRYIQQQQGLFPGSWWERAITKVKDALSAYREVGRRNGDE